MGEMRVGQPSRGLAYLALGALLLQLLLSVSAPTSVVWSPSHAHISLDGLSHPHTHAWERIPGHETDKHATSEPAPSQDGGLGGAMVLPIALAFFAVAGAYVLALAQTTSMSPGVPWAPAPPPPRA